MKSKLILVALAAISFTSATVAASIPPGLFAPIPATAPAPADNPTTPAKVELGKQLYFDRRISSTGSVSCDSCHSLAGAGNDGLPVSVGIKGLTGKRTAPTVWNSGLLSAMFWDGRAATLEEQAKGPMV